MKKALESPENKKCIKVKHRQFSGYISSKKMSDKSR